MSQNQIKSESVMEFVNTIIGAYESGFVNSATLTLAELYRIAQNHCKDNHQVEVKSLIDQWGEELAKKLHPNETDQATEIIKAMAAEKPKEAVGALAGNLTGLLYALSETDGEKDITIESSSDGADITIHAKQPLYYVHQIGPDDVHGPMTEVKAFRMANDLNKSSAQLRNESERAEFYPYTVALVKTAEQLGIIDEAEVAP